MLSKAPMLPIRVKVPVAPGQPCADLWQCPRCYLSHGTIDAALRCSLSDHPHQFAHPISEISGGPPTVLTPATDGGTFLHGWGRVFAAFKRKPME